MSRSELRAKPPPTTRLLSYSCSYASRHPSAFARRLWHASAPDRAHPPSAVRYENAPAIAEALSFDRSRAITTPW